MPDIFENAVDVKFVEKLVNGRYPVRVPAFLDHHAWFSDWETARFLSMESLLRPRMVFLDIGAFDGFQDAIISRFVGGAQHMILVEPAVENWPNIKATWEANHILDMPAATYMGFIGPDHAELPVINYTFWPKGPDYSKLIAVTKFKLLNEHRHNTPSLTLDDFVKCVPIPDAINIDVEGGELLVLQSGERFLSERSPLIWLSVHPEFLIERYGTDPSEVHKCIESFGYKGEYLGADHEEHFLYRK